MIKIACLLKKKEGLSDAEFKRYYEEEHAPLAMRLLPVFHEYSRSYIVRDERYIPAHIPQATNALFCDVITQITFKTEEDFEKLMSLQAAPVIAKTLADDEARFLDRNSMIMFIVDELRTPPNLLKA
jgi:hypothetical protein